MSTSADHRSSVWGVTVVALVLISGAAVVSGNGAGDEEPATPLTPSVRPPPSPPASTPTPATASSPAAISSLLISATQIAAANGTDAAAMLWASAHGGEHAAVAACTRHVYAVTGAAPSPVGGRTPPSPAATSSPLISSSADTCALLGSALTVNVTLRLATALLAFPAVLQSAAARLLSTSTEAHLKIASRLADLFSSGSDVSSPDGVAALISRIYEAESLLLLAVAEGGGAAMGGGAANRTSTPDDGAALLWSGLAQPRASDVRAVIAAVTTAVNANSADFSWLPLSGNRSSAPTSSLATTASPLQPVVGANSSAIHRNASAVTSGEALASLCAVWCGSEVVADREEAIASADEGELSAITADGRCLCFKASRPSEPIINASDALDSSSSVPPSLLAWLASRSATAVSITTAWTKPIVLATAGIPAECCSPSALSASSSPSLVAMSATIRPWSVGANLSGDASSVCEQWLVGDAAAAVLQGWNAASAIGHTKTVNTTTATAPPIAGAAKLWAASFAALLPQIDQLRVPSADVVSLLPRPSFLALIDMVDASNPPPPPSKEGSSAASPLGGLSVTLTAPRAMLSFARLSRWSPTCLPSILRMDSSTSSDQNATSATSSSSAAVSCLHASPNCVVARAVVPSTMTTTSTAGPWAAAVLSLPTASLPVPVCCVPRTLADALVNGSGNSDVDPLANAAATFEAANNVILYAIGTVLGLIAIEGCYLIFVWARRSVCDSGGRNNGGGRRGGEGTAGSRLPAAPPLRLNVPAGHRTVQRLRSEDEALSLSSAFLFGLRRVAASSARRGGDGGEEYGARPLPPWQPQHAGDDCAFCLDPLSALPTVAELPCGHLFHVECLREYLKYQIRRFCDMACPICQRNILSSPGDDDDNEHERPRLEGVGYQHNHHDGARDEGGRATPPPPPSGMRGAAALLTAAESAGHASPTRPPPSTSAPSTPATALGGPLLQTPTTVRNAAVPLQLGAAATPANPIARRMNTSPQRVARRLNVDDML